MTRGLSGRDITVRPGLEGVSGVMKGCDMADFVGELVGDRSRSSPLPSPDLNREKIEDENADFFKGLSDTAKGFSLLEGTEGAVSSGKGRDGLDSRVISS